MSKTIYWNEKGLHQEEMNRLCELIPSMGYTDNNYMNLFIVMNKVYHDVYNNDGCNLFDCYEKDFKKYSKPFFPEIELKHLSKDEEFLEEYSNKVLEFIKDKDLTYTKHSIYCSFDTLELSMTPREGFNEISFGDKDDLDSWISQNIRGLKYIFVA